MTVPLNVLPMSFPNAKKQPTGVAKQLFLKFVRNPQELVCSDAQVMFIKHYAKTEFFQGRSR